MFKLGKERKREMGQTSRRLMKAPGWPFRSGGHVQPLRVAKPTVPARAEQARARATKEDENMIDEILKGIQKTR
jgi:hypothetical protein